MEKERKTARALQAEETKKRIFKAATTLLENKKIESIKISDITKEANIAAGTFYLYYRTKWDVFLEAYRYVNDYFDEEVRPNLTQPHVRDRLLFFFDSYAVFNSTVQDVRFTKLLYNATNTIFNKNDFTDEHITGVLGLLNETLQKGLDDGQLKASEDVKEMTRMFMIAVRGLMFNWCCQDGDYELRPAMRWYVDNLISIYLAD